MLLLGQEASKEAALALLKRYRTRRSRCGVEERRRFLGCRPWAPLQVKTPDRSMDVLLNGWLLYQTLACRVWGRTAFYQIERRLRVSRSIAGCDGAMRGAAHRSPASTFCVPHRASLRPATFSTGGCPTSGLGVKTRVSDDRVWLPFVVRTTSRSPQDVAVLDEAVSFPQRGTARSRQPGARLRLRRRRRRPHRCTSTAYERSIRVLPSARTAFLCSARAIGTTA